MKRLLALFVLLFAIGGQVMAASPAPCIFQSLWTLCLTRNIYVGNNAATVGTLTNPSNLEDATGFYRDNSNNALASATQTGYTRLYSARTTASGTTAFGVATNYQDAQTIGTTLVSTNEKAALTVSGDGTSTFGIGVKLPTTVGTASLLDAYQDGGTWTPSIACAGGAITTGTQVGGYVLVGKAVIAHAYLTWSKNTCTGAITVTGLPFTTKNTSNYFQAGSTSYVRNFTPPAVYGIVSGQTNSGPNVYAAPNTTTITMVWNLAGSTPQAVSSTDTASANNELMFSLIYQRN